jgi:CO/xanthine dehydrogenase Mo-binding subunit
MTTMGRREFLATGAGLLVVGVTWRPAAAAQALALGRAPARPSRNPEELDAWLTIGTDGRVTIYTGRIDMGTGIQTAFAQVLADELEVPYESVDVVMGDTGLTPDQGKSTGSSNINRGLLPLRAAAAEARQVLLELAGERLQTPVAGLVVQDGVVRVAADPGRQVTYGALLEGRRFDRRLKMTQPTARYPGWDAPRPDGRGPLLEGTAPLKTREFRYVGQSVPRRDVPAKVTGTHQYVHTVRVPGMVHGRVVRPPAIGATLVRVDERSVRNVPGLIQVVRVGNFLGVVAEREEQAMRAAQQLKAQWQAASRPMPNSTDVSQWLKAAKPIQTATRNRGDVDAAFARAPRVMRATYEWPVQNHAMLGPSCAVADVRPGQVTVWSSSQWVQQTRRDLARMLRVPVDDVRVIWREGSGSYGRQACDDAAADAAVLSHAVGRPVRVQWTRQDEHGWEPKSPPMVMDLRGAVDVQGDVLGFELETWSPSHSMAEVGNFLAWRLMGGHPGWDRLSGGEGAHEYQFENDRTIGHYVEEILRALYLRSPGGVQHTFAIESFIDELAADAGADPLEYRLRYLKDERAIRLMRAVADKARWQSQTPRRASRPTSGIVSGRGICFATRQAAAVADVDVNLDTGTIRVTRAFVSARCGRIVNPEGMRHQVEGAFLQGLSRALFEEVTFEGGRVTSIDWNTYPIMRFPDVPVVETVLLDEPEVASEGLGEIATDPAPAAVGNAAFHAAGIRLRQVPFTPARVKAALARA